MGLMKARGRKTSSAPAGRTRSWHGFLGFRPAVGVAALAMLGVVAVVALAQPPRVRIVRGFPSPGDYPEGVAWDGSGLWCNNFTDGSLHKVDSADGGVLEHYQGQNLPGSPEGLAWDGQYLWSCDWHQGIIVQFRPTPTGIEVENTFPKPANSGPSVGLEWDGTSIWLSCWPDLSQGLEFGQLFKLDPVTLAVQQRHVLPVRYIEDLAWDGRYLWSAEWLRGIGFAIEPATGDTLHTYNTPGLYPVGNAWDGTYLWVTDTDKDSIWALDISGITPTASVSWSHVKNLFRGR